jgi:hypothetical protein
MGARKWPKFWCAWLLIAEHLALLPVQRLGQLRDIGDRGIGRSHGVDDTALIGADVQLHPEVPVRALARLVHLGVARRTGVFGRTRRRDDSRIDDGPRAQQRAARFEQAANRVEDCAGKAVLLQQMAKAQSTKRPPSARFGPVLVHGAASRAGRGRFSVSRPSNPPETPFFQSISQASLPPYRFTKTCSAPQPASGIISKISKNQP